MLDHPPTPPLEPLPCPFCGQIPTIEPWHGGPPTKVMIACPAEYVGECVGPQTCGDTRAEAIELWNRRASHPRETPAPKGVCEVNAEHQTGGCADCAYESGRSDEKEFWAMPETPAPTPTRAAVEEAIDAFRCAVSDWYGADHYLEPMRGPKQREALKRRAETRAALLALFDAPPRGEAVASAMDEAYPPNWKHCLIHLNPETGEMHSDGDHSVRAWIESHIKSLAALPVPPAPVNPAPSRICVVGEHDWIKGPAPTTVGQRQGFQCSRCGLYYSEK